MALGAIDAARMAGLRVPEDLSVVGFGNTSVALRARPALTTVSMPRHELGVAAMDAILAALESRVNPVERSGTRATRIQARQLPFDIVVRASSAPLAPGKEARVA